MKKTFHFVIITWLFLSSLLIAKNHMDFTLPQGIDIQLHVANNQDQEKTLNKILEKCQMYHLDIYKTEYLGSKGHKELYKVYYTNTSSSGLLSSLSIINKEYTEDTISTEYSDDKPYVKAFNIDVNYEFHDLKKAIHNTTIEGVYKIISFDESKIDAFISALENEDVIVDILGAGTSVPTNEYTELIIFYIVMILLLSFYRIIQNQKDISIKKMHGYSNKNIVFENNLNLVKQFIRYVFFITIVDVVLLVVLHEFDSLLDYIDTFYIIQSLCLAILLALNNISNLYLLKIHPVFGIKHLSKDIVVDISSMIVKIATLIMITIYGISLSNIAFDIYDISSNIKNWETTKNQFYTITQGYYPSTVEEEVVFEQKFKLLYMRLQDTKLASLLDATSFHKSIPKGTNTSWSYDYSKIIVNRNYMRNSNLPESIHHRIITYDVTDTLILIPSNLKEDEEIIKANFFENLPLNHKDIDRIKVILYDEDISMFTANVEVDTKGNIVQNPILVVDDQNFQGFYYLSAFSSGSIHIPVQNTSNPYEDVKDDLLEVELDNTIKITPLVYSRYSEKISEYNASIAKLSLQLFILCIIGCTVIYNAIVIFFTKNSKEIAIKKMMGYKNREIYSSYYKDMIFTCLISNVCLYLYLQHLGYLPILCLLIVFEIFITKLLIFMQERRKILSMLKGNN